MAKKKRAAESSKQVVKDKNKKNKNKKNKKNTSSTPSKASASKASSEIAKKTPSLVHFADPPEVSLETTTKAASKAGSNCETNPEASSEESAQVIETQVVETTTTNPFSRPQRSCTKNVIYADNYDWSSDESVSSFEGEFLKESQFRFTRLNQFDKVKISCKTEDMKDEVLLDGEITEVHESKFLVCYKTPKGKTEKKFFIEEDLFFANFKMKKGAVVLKKNKKKDPSLIIIKEIEDNKIHGVDYFTKEKLHCWRNQIKAASPATLSYWRSKIMEKLDPSMHDSSLNGPKKHKWNRNWRQNFLREIDSKIDAKIDEKLDEAQKSNETAFKEVNKKIDFVSENVVKIFKALQGSKLASMAKDTASEEVSDSTEKKGSSKDNDEEGTEKKSCTK